jgi:UDP-2,4-diacetamido-2,4,6-trideoxy-beta-L-altropyranose hydrolase
MSSLPPAEPAPGVLLRADASTELGAGHVSRCLALAHALRARGARPVLVTRGAGHALARDSGIPVAQSPGETASTAWTEDEVPSLLALARERNAHWIVIDHYQAGDESLAAMSATERVRVALLDDVPARHGRGVHLLVNVSFGVSRRHYPQLSPEAVVLLGPRFALLHPAFAAARGAQARPQGPLRRILIVPGGADTAGLAAPVAEDLARALPQAEIDVVRGPLSAGARVPSGDRIRVLGPLSASDLARAMSQAQAAVATPSTVGWELAAVGVPSVLVRTAANQELNAAGWKARAAARVLEPGDDVALAFMGPDGLCSAAVRAGLSEAASSLCDGRGAERVADAMMDASTDRRTGADSGPTVHLRASHREDRGLLWAWVNDPDSRASAFRTGPIPWPEHAAWHDRVLRDGAVLQWIAVAGGVPVGQVRFDLHGDEARVDVAIAPECRGRGLAPVLLRLGVDALVRARGPHRVLAEVRVENEPSLRAFARAGFREEGTAVTGGARCVRLVLDAARERRT